MEQAEWKLLPARGGNGGQRRLEEERYRILTIVQAVGATPLSRPRHTSPARPPDGDEGCLWPISSWAAASTAATACSWRTAKGLRTTRLRPFEGGRPLADHLRARARAGKPASSSPTATRRTRFTISCHRAARLTTALNTRAFEPDAPNFTPRISAMAALEDGGFSLRNEHPARPRTRGRSALQALLLCVRAGLEAVGHFIHTYTGRRQPHPSFAGEPERVSLPEGCVDCLRPRQLWNALDAENQVSLCTRAIDLAPANPHAHRLQQ